MRYIVDANLPYYFSTWNNENFIHVKDIDDEWTDEEIWSYAYDNGLTIISKDSDFSDRIMLTEPPPRVIHIRFGNVNMKTFHELITNRWDDIAALSNSYKLVNVFKKHIEGID